MKLRAVRCLVVIACVTAAVAGSASGLSRPSRSLPMAGSKIACGYDFCLTVNVDGSLWAWGKNGDGQLGLGDTKDRHSPTRVGTANDWAAVAGGLSHSLALKTDGSLWAWGLNNHGQLGLGDSVLEEDSPTQVGTATDWVAVACGWEHSLALKSDGTLWAWGDNSSGQLAVGSAGLPSVTTVADPIQVGSGKDWVVAAAGGDSSLGLKNQGSLWGWGNNRSGQLGLGNRGPYGVKVVPTRVGVAGDWSAIACGGFDTLALKADGSLWAWGSNKYGELGLGDAKGRLIPTRVGRASNWTAVACSGVHSLALKTNGSLWAWGMNNHGQLGLGDTTQRHTPKRVGVARGWTAIACGSYYANGDHNLALREDGSLWAWGGNGAGQLGLGDTKSRHVPTRVPGWSLSP